MIGSETAQWYEMSSRRPQALGGRVAAAAPRSESAFRDAFIEIFDAQFNKVFRYLDRVSGDPELAADIAQEAFLKLYQRGSLPDSPEAWMISVSMNLLRNAKSTKARRGRLLTQARARHAHSDQARSPALLAGAQQERSRVRATLDRLPERERSLLLLRAEGYRYRDIAKALRVPESSVGTLLARAKKRFREAFHEESDAS